MKYSYFQKLDILSSDDFQQVVAHADEVIHAKTYRAIHPDGTIQSAHKHAQIASSAIANYNFDIDSYSPHLTEGFVKVLRATQQALIENELTNPKPYMVRGYRNDVLVGWHKHFGDAPKAEWLKYYGKSLPTLEKLWVVIFYMHPNWDTSYLGDLQVGYTESKDLTEFPCLSNSIVAHHGEFGHSVKKLKFGYEGHRDVFMSHWIVD